MKTRNSIIVVSALILTLAVMYWLKLGRSGTDMGAWALVDAMFALALIFLLLLFGAALGLKVVRWLDLESISGLEILLFSAPVGLGVIAYGVLVLGLIGLLTAWGIIAELVIVGVFTWREQGEVVSLVCQRIKAFPAAWKEWDGLIKILFSMFALIFSLALIQSLTPAWDVDGLIYHLQGPRLFLEVGRIVPDFDNFLLFYPFTTEMLFTIGLSLGSEPFAKLLHYSFAIMLALGTYAFGKRYLNHFVGVLAAAILIGIPIFPIWASFAYNDIIWAVFEFLSLYAAFLWLKKNKQRRWLAIAGILMGFAIGVKYMALAGGLVLGLWILWKSRSSGWKTVLANGLWFGGIALLVGAPWYLKNLAWTGNPVYPLFFTTEGWAAGRINLWLAYMNGFGSGHSLVDYLLLPVRLYSQYYRFGTFMGSIEIPSLLFPFLLFYPWTRKSEITNGLLLWVFLRFVAWAMGAQQTRYLLPIFPALSLLTAHVLVDLMGRFPKTNLGRVLVMGLALGMVAATMVYSLLYFIMVQPHQVILGLESKSDFLNRVTPHHVVMEYIKENISPDERVMMLWDGRGYFCDDRCIPDVTQSQWTQLASKTWDVGEVSQTLGALGVSHLLFSLQDMNFVAQYDLSGEQKRAAAFLLEDFIPACTKDIYRDEYYRLLELTCD